LLFSSGWTVSAARAADDSNIPGLPLPGQVVTGSLGGPIYDHVYSLDVPPSSIILASLTGDPGTDFDLYLFDQSATTVYSTAGQVGSSTGDTSTESISYATVSGGRYYLDLNGATNVEGAFRLVVAIKPDTTAPGALLRLNGGASATTSPFVTVTLLGTDDLSGVGEMSLSVDGTHWGAFVEYTPTFLWEFPAGDRSRTLWARVRDRAGNVSAATSATIVVDTVPPTVVGRTPEPGGTIAGLRPTIAVTFSEAIDPETWFHQGLVVQTVSGETIEGEYQWDAATRTGTFVPEDRLIAGQPVVCSLIGITDPAGNALGPLGTWLVTPLLSHTVTIAAKPAVVVAETKTTISGKVDGPVYAPMTLEQNLGSGWEPLSSVQPTTSGAFSTSLVVQQTTSFRIRVGTSQVEATTTSGTIRVLARRGVALAGVSPGRTSSGKVNATRKLVAVVTPTGAPPVSVTLKITRFDRTSRTWKPSATLRASTVGGRATFTWRPTSRAAYRLQLSTPPTAQFANGVSSLYAWTIS
jgi:hypothetical protein